MIAFISRGYGFCWIVDIETAGRFYRHTVCRPDGVSPVSSAVMSGFRYQPTKSMEIIDHWHKNGCPMFRLPRAYEMVQLIALFDVENEQSDGLMVYRRPFTGTGTRIGPVAGNSEFWKTFLAIEEAAVLF